MRDIWVMVHRIFLSWLPEVAGTLAGFDTVVVISPSRELAIKLYELFMEHVDPDNLL